MKIRNGFVSNSSSCSFQIMNTTNEQRTLVDFVNENPQLLEKFLDTYDWYKNNPKFSPENLLKSAEEEKEVFKPYEIKDCIFGDEDGTLIGHVFDYVLRDGGISQSFHWKFIEALR